MTLCEQSVGVGHTVRMTDEDPGPVVQRLILGEKLRALREASGTGLDEANARVKWYRGKLSKVENGMLGLTEKELGTLLKAYGVGGPEAAEVSRLRAEARRRAAPERVSDWAKQYIPLERAASEISMVYAEIPGLLQTKQVAMITMRQSPVIRASEVEAMAAAREQRGNRLYGEHAPQVRALLGEEAFARQIGPAHVMRDQLKRLREMSDLPNVSIRAIPFDRGRPVGLTSPFTLLWIEPARASVAYVETLTNADYVKTITPYTLAFEQAEHEALSDEDSQVLLDRYIAATD